MNHGNSYSRIYEHNTFISMLLDVVMICLNLYFENYQSASLNQLEIIELHSQRAEMQLAIK